MRHVVAVSIGDIYGIGPEIVFKACVHPSVRERVQPIVFSPRGVLESFAPSSNVPINYIDATRNLQPDSINVFETAGKFEPEAIGKTSAQGGGAAIAAIEAATAAVLNGSAEAIVTAPISKESIALAGSAYRGHTEMLRDLSGASEVMMMLVSKTMRVSLVTIHTPLRDVPNLITESLILDTIEMSVRALQNDFGIPQPRLAVLGLNPHAGDGGYLGPEEQEIVTPAIEEAKASGHAVSGPFAADAFFSAYSTTSFDCIVAMYHDQGLIPLKMSAHGKAVNVSCGLPIVRTSPDHGTAFDIAGKGVADAASMIEAMLMACEIVEHRGKAQER
ncbi:MAG: 4-hydroxythreonine-4-phosphate dehydrogenase PdxA [Ectothiorhodospiraceae bacterium]|nr:4-hydroxythreonine-4-phosphate dehydrogenase PdxA [Ectothiorhodospiraceae bacterium]